MAGYHTADATRPANKQLAVTPSDSVDLPGVTRGIYVGTGGTVVVVPVDGDATVTYTNVANGQVLPIQITRVNATSTTASGIIAWF